MTSCTCNICNETFQPLMLKTVIRDVNGFPATICNRCAEHYTDRDLSPGLDDTADFIATDEFGVISGRGVIMKLYKNGKADITKDGRTYRTHLFTVISKAA